MENFNFFNEENGKRGRQTVALIFGGRGEEHNISVASAKYIYSVIDREKFSPLPILITKGGRWLVCSSVEDTEDGTPCYPARWECGSGLMTGAGFIPVSVAFPVLHGDFGEDGKIQGALDTAGISYVGCGTTAGALCSDKAYTKTVAEREGIPTAPWVLGTEPPTPEYIQKIKRRAELSFGYPMFIKPACLGSSIGTSRISSGEEFASAYIGAAKYGLRVLIEAALRVERELECAVFVSKRKQMFAKIGSVSLGGGFYDYGAKYLSASDAKVFAEAKLTPAAEEAVLGFSRALVSSLSVRQLSRIDFFLTSTGEVIFNEINTMPGFTDISLYPRLMEGLGLSPTELVTRLICEASL